MTSTSVTRVDAVFRGDLPTSGRAGQFRRAGTTVCAVTTARSTSLTTVLATLPADHGCSDDHRGALFFLSINELTRCAPQ